MNENIETRLLLSENDNILEIICNSDIFNSFNEIRITDVNESYCIIPNNVLNK